MSAEFKLLASIVLGSVAAALGAVLGDSIGAGMFGLTGLAAAVLFLLPPLALRRRAGET